MVRGGILSCRRERVPIADFGNCWDQFSEGGPKRMPTPAYTCEKCSPIVASFARGAEPIPPTPGLCNEPRGTQVEIGDELQLRTESDSCQHGAKRRGVVLQTGVPLALCLNGPCGGHGSKGSDIFVDSSPCKPCQSRGLGTSSKPRFLPLQEFRGATPPNSWLDGRI